MLQRLRRAFLRPRSALDAGPSFVSSRFDNVIECGRLLERRSELRRRGLEVVARCDVLGSRTTTKAKPVPRIARDDVQVDVKDFLPGGFTIREEQVYALASNWTRSQSSGDLFAPRS